jgi:hypothetical protein
MALQNAEVARKQRSISFLKQKNAQIVEELMGQHKAITKLKRQLEDKERQSASYLHKVSFKYFQSGVKDTTFCSF